MSGLGIQRVDEPVGASLRTHYHGARVSARAASAPTRACGRCVPAAFAGNRPIVAARLQSVTSRHKVSKATSERCDIESEQTLHLWQCSLRVQG